MANTQIAISKNGKTTLATAGKYCERNIDINVAVTSVGDDIPAYVKSEADSLALKVASAQGNKVFTLAAITDLHYGNGNYTNGILHASQALSYINKQITLDAFAVLGDYTDGYPIDNVDNAFGDCRKVNSLLSPMESVPNMRIQGNHDFYSGYANFVHYHIQAYSEGVTWGDKNGGYFYRDFANKKLRIICVNTTETNNDKIYVSDAQYNWFISALDLSAKSDASDWQILILSHHPLDWYASTYVFAYILEAYKAGSSWSSGNISCNFSGKNAATLIGNIHGHIHNLLIDYINKGNVVNPNPTNVLRICTPEACINRANQYNGAWKDTATYNKTTNSANDTSFVIYCIDLNAQNIKAFCYGAGYDREISYAPVLPTVYNIVSNLTNCTVSGTNTIVEEGTATITVSANNGYKLPDTISVSGASYTYDKFSGTVILSNPVNDVTVTVVATEVELPYTNMILKSINTDGSIYNGGLGYKNDYRISSTSGGETARAGYACTGFIPVKANDIIYGSPGILDGNVGWVCLTFYDSSFTKITSFNVQTTINSLVKNEDNSFSLPIIADSKYMSTSQVKTVAYFRMGSEGLYNGNAIITINQPIVDSELSYTNMIPNSINADGTQYVGINGEDGYKTGYRLNSSGVETAATNMGVTGFIPVKKGDTIYMKDMKIVTKSGETGIDYCYIALYNTSFTSTASVKASSYVSGTSHSYVIDSFTTDSSGYVTSFIIKDKYNEKLPGGSGYMRISAYQLDDNAIITVNEPIESTVYNITNNLTNCVINGTSTIVKNGTATMIIIANDGYQLPDTINVSGANYTWNKSSGTIVLNNPTDNIVITVIAVEGENEPSYTNQVMNSVENDGITPYNGGQRYKTNTRYNSSCAEAEFDSIISGYIPYNSNVKVIRIKGFTKEPTNNDYFYTFDENFQRYGKGTSVINHFLNRYSQWLSNWPTATKFEMGEDGVGMITLNLEELDKVSNTYPPILRESKWIRFNVTYATPENFIITFDEEIK